MGALRIVASEGEAPPEAVTLRTRVFVGEQGVTERDEIDGRDPECIHFIAWRGTEPVACARLRPLGEDRAKVERVAVQRALRGRDLGRRVMQAVEAEAARRGWRRLTLHAQLSVVTFYDRLGWETRGGEFEEAGIRHRAMEKTLA
jgi:predicted GNAT family N-acyltransferase